MSDRVVIDGDVSLTRTIDGEGGVYFRIGQNPVIEALNVTANGTYEAPDGVDGYSPVTVDVPLSLPVIEPLNVTENGVYTAPDGVDGYSPVTVTLPEYEGAYTVEPSTEEQTLATAGKVMTGDVTVEAVALITKTITENGGYSASDDGADGFSEVTVNVPATGYTLDDIVDGSANPTGDVVLETNKIVSGFLAGKAITSLIADNVTSIASNALSNCTSLTSASFKGNIGSLYGKNSIFNGCKNLVNVEFNATNTMGSSTFQNCSSLPSITLKNVTYLYDSNFQNCSSLTTADFGSSLTYMRYENFRGSGLKTLILRSNSVVRIANVNNFLGSPFASDGTGGTLYVPQSMIASYQADSNWSTLLGYANNQILQIEGSIYETQYADGTPIQ